MKMFADMTDEERLEHLDELHGVGFPEGETPDLHPEGHAWDHVLFGSLLPPHTHDPKRS